MSELKTAKDYADMYYTLKNPDRFSTGTVWASSMIEAIERIDAAETALAAANATIERLTQKLEIADARSVTLNTEAGKMADTIARLSAPVSDAEDKSWGGWLNGSRMMYREDVSKLIATRAQEPK